MANKFDHLTGTERGSAPSTPATGDWAVYFKSDGFYVIDDAGTELGPLSAGDLAAHLADTTDAHDASAISVLDTAANFTGTDVEAVLAELAGGGASVSDDAYGAGWDGVTTIAPSKNAVYDKIETISGGGGATPVSSTVLTSEGTASTSYVGLTTAHTAAVTVPASGKILVMVTVDIACNAGPTTSRVSFALSGANTQASSDNYSIRWEGNANFVDTKSMIVPLSGLNTGSTTVTVECKSTGGNTVTLAKRHLTVWPA